MLEQGQLRDQTFGPNESPPQSRQSDDSRRRDTPFSPD